MLNHLRWVASLSPLLCLMSPAFADSDPGLSRLRYQYPPASSSALDVPVCYLETGTGEILNLARLCNPEGSGRDRSASPDEPCYFVDDNGRPCAVNTVQQETQP
ncbi:MAG: hypothetical protein AAFW84_25325 [Cyanobacteria bacterium J06635_15]